MAFDFKKVRREFHQIPEVGYEEIKTQALILDYINQLPQDHLIVKTWRTGILVKIKGRKPSKTIGFRTDIDGLPITEETGYDFKSRHVGYMHACGHDFHMTIALGILEHFANQPVNDDVVIIFQPAEEGPGGARPMLESNVFQEFRPDIIFGLHIAPELPVGTIGTRVGMLFANTSELFIDFVGKGGHAAYPHMTHDMVVASSAFVTQIQSIISRSVNPIDAAVITIGKITGGTRQNIIAETARLEGTIRARHQETMQEIKRQIENHARGIEIAYQCQVSIDYGSNYYQVYNHSKETEAFMSFCKQNSKIKLIESDEAMTGEDFGYFLKEIPGFMFWLGVNSEAGLHSSTLKPEESALPVAIDLVTDYIRNLAHN